jgi:hypothetical protein
MTRYYKATDTMFTVFRSTTSRVYRSAWIEPGTNHVRDFGFSEATPQHARMGRKTVVPAVEISKAEYDDLKLAQSQRLGGSLSRSSTRDSWVRL